MEKEQFIGEFKKLLVVEEPLTLNSYLTDLESYDSLFVLELIQFYDEKFNISLELSIFERPVRLQELYEITINH